MDETPLSPMLLVPELFAKVWGGRALERLGKRLPAGEMIGESWEVADMPTTSASGAGGRAVRSVVASGELAGVSVTGLVASRREELLGASALSDAGGFPLLVKFLDARENLSVQVHPSPAYAAANPACKLKTECWYIMDHEPGAVIYKGVRPGMTRDVFAAAIAGGTVQELLIAVPAVRGECHNLPSGTCHALGAGVLVAEVQTPSDTTFRIYDWGRAGRELHVEQALACIDFGPAPAATRLEVGKARSRLVTTEFFTLDQARIGVGTGASMSEPVEGNGEARGQRGRCRVVVAISGEVTLISTGAMFRPVQVRAGETALVPASVAGATRVESVDGGEVLIACVLG